MLRAAYRKLMAPVLPPRAGAISDVRSAGELDGVLLFEEVVGAIHLAAAQVAAVASGTNALGTERSPREPRELKSLLPSELALVADLARCERQLRLDHKALRATAAFAEELNNAHLQVNCFCGDIEGLGLQQACFFHLLPLRSTLKGLARHALKATEALGPDVGRCLSKRYALNTETLRRLLDAVINGKAPCIDAEGKIAVPQLPQRRPQLRLGVHMSCTVEHEGKARRALLKDISTGGGGLEKATDLTPGKVIIMELANRRFLSGVVVWAKGGKAGIKFDIPLSPSDPLFAG